MDPSRVINDGAPFNLAEIWQFSLNGVSAGDSSTTRGFAGLNLAQQFRNSNLSHAVTEGNSGAWKPRDDESASTKVVSTSNCNYTNEVENKRQKKDGKAEEGSADTNTEETKQQFEPTKDYIHVRARRGQATDSHSLAERARREKISERMKILQDLVPGCNKVIGKALVLDEIINYIQSLQHQVEFLSMKLEAVNSRMNPGIEYGQQAFENQEMEVGSQSRRDYSRGGGGSPEWLHTQIGSGGFQRTSS